MDGSWALDLFATPRETLPPSECGREWEVTGRIGPLAGRVDLGEVQTLARGQVPVDRAVSCSMGGNGLWSPTDLSLPLASPVTLDRLPPKP